MKRILLTILIGLSLNANAAITVQQMQDVKVRICKAAKINPGKCVLIDSEDPNAYTNMTARVYIHKGLLTYVDTIDEFAAIYAHELSHIINGDIFGKNEHKGSIYMEKRADELGRKIMIRAGYNPLGGAAFFQKLANQQGIDGGGTHPDNDIRVEFWRTGKPYSKGR